MEGGASHLIWTRGLLMMRTRFWSGVLTTIAMWLTATAAQAHPHAWVTIMTELLYAPDCLVANPPQAGDARICRKRPAVECKTRFGRLTDRLHSRLAKPNMPCLPIDRLWLCESTTR